MESSSTKTIVAKTNHHHRQKATDLLYTIDILTDGSEGTGDGTLFLSVWKNMKIDNNNTNSINDNNDNDDEWYRAAPAARYCLSGAMNADATSRLAADQRFKLGTSLRAIFCAPSQQRQQQQQDSSCCQWWGITPLHLALRKAGAASVHVVVADPPSPPSCRDDDKTTGQGQAANDTLEKVIALTEGGGAGRLYPVVHICKVPQIDELSSSSPSTQTPCWWKVYQDEYILVHARRMTRNNNNASSSSSPVAVLFLYTLISQEQVAKQNHGDNGKGKEDEACSSSFYTSFLVSSPHDCSLPDLENIMRRMLASKNHNNNSSNSSSKSMQLPVVSPSELIIHDNIKRSQHLDHEESNHTTTTTTTTTTNNNNKDDEIPIQCRFAIGLRPSVPTSSKTPDRQEMNKPSSSDSDSCSGSSCSSDDDDVSSDESSSSSSSSSSNSSSFVNDNVHGDDAVYWTQPSPSADPSLLVRAQQQGIEWNEEVPEFFSWNNNNNHCHSSDDDDDNNNDTEASCSREQRILGNHSRNRRRLQTGTSLAFTANQDEKPFIVDRMAKIILRRPKHSNNGSENNGDSSSISKSDNGLPRQKWPHRLLDFLKSPIDAAANVSGPPLRAEEVDENEIDLDDDHEDDSGGNSGDMNNSSGVEDKSYNNRERHHVVKLLVLGTGCASPSAYRGASGYTLLFPEMVHPEWAMVIEAGEGFVTQWHRHATMSIGKIRFIWVSHAHWDHYGGLAPLLVAIAKAPHTHPRMHDGDETKCNKQYGHQRKKLRRCDATPTTCTPSSLSSSSTPCPDDSLDHDPPWVMAPRKVLKFLELVLPIVKSNNGQCRRYYRGVSMDEHSNNNTYRRRAPTSPSAHCPSDAFDDLNKNYGRPIAFWENIQVDHCKSAFGFVAGLRRNANFEATASTTLTNGYNVDDDPFIFAFSGDTRPCPRFVRVCQTRAQTRCHACGDNNLPHDDDNHVHFLLHEATFDEEEQEMAIAKKHSTIREALEVAQNVKAERVLLTHFSQRYNNDSLFNNTDTTTNDKDTTTSPVSNTPKVGVALDGMLVPLYDPQLI